MHLLKPRAKTAANEPQEIWIRLGADEFKMVFDFNASADYEELSGESIMQGQFKPSSALSIRRFFYCCLKQNYPEITEEFVGQHLFMAHLQEAMTICLRLILNVDSDDRALAPFVPTPIEVIEAGLEAAGLSAGEVFADLGCGDGRVLTAALARHPKRVIGWEIHEGRAAMAEEVLKMSKAPAGSRIFQDPVQEAEFKGVDVAFVYLLPDANAKLDAKLRQLAPTSRIITHDFPMQGWTPASEQALEIEDRTHTVYVYRLADQPWNQVAQEPEGGAQ